MQKAIILVACLGMFFMSTVPVNSEQTQTDESEKTVILCHEGKTITVTEADVPTYLEQGATKGACPETSPPAEKSDEEDQETDKEKGMKKVTLCHKGKTTITIAEAAVPAHLKHGDTKGACPDSSSETSVEKQQEEQTSEQNNEQNNEQNKKQDKKQDKNQNKKQNKKQKGKNKKK